MVVGAELFAHPVGDDGADGEAVVAHHLAEAVEGRRLHLKIAQPPSLVTERLHLLVVAGIGQSHA